MRKFFSLHDVLEPLKQVLSASRDVIISGQICGSNRGKCFTLGDGCWLPNSLRLRSWKKGSPLPIPPPKRFRRFDAMPPTPLGPFFCPVCKEDLGSVAALGAHYNSFHAIRDNQNLPSNARGVIWFSIQNGAFEATLALAEISSYL